MATFEHYLYVLECGDGSLYTGYTTDVAARLAAHRVGRGAKYTKSHAPVRLLASARFYSKSRAMSAEAHFKKLPRDAKRVLLAQAASDPFEVVLCRELPGFGQDAAPEFVARGLATHIDPDHRAFMSKLLPTVDASRIAGVRTPALRAIAKRLVRRDDAKTFLRALPHTFFEENQVHAFAIGEERDYGRAIKLYQRFLSHIDNWATCDQLPVDVLATRPEETLGHVEEWLASAHCYTVRFAIGVLMRLFLEERFEPRFLEAVSAARLPDAPERPQPESDAYYVDMMRAWYFAEALARQEAAALPYFQQGSGAVPLDEWTRRKAIQKAIESRRIVPALKDCLRSWR